MKKTLLLIGAACAFLTAQSQIVVSVLQPDSLVASLDFTWASDWGATPDLNNPANAVQAFTAFASDGSAADSLACDPLVNGVDVAGKIAVLYRDVCNFSTKALNCQNAGAIAAVIINNIPGAPVGMGAGDDGPNVTIPVVMISQDAGATLHDAIAAGGVEMYIGSVIGQFPNNMAVKDSDLLVPRFSAVPGPTASADQFSTDMGGWICNFGSSEQSGVTLHATVSQGGTSVYDNTSDPGTVPVNDSTFFTLPSFSQSSYSGLYTITYSVDYGNTDDYPDDNSFTTNLSVDTLLATGRIDSTGMTAQDAFYQPNPAATQNFEMCIPFISPHGSLLQADGIYVAATHSTPGTMIGQELTTHLYEWNDDITGVSDAAFDQLSEIINGEYAYQDSLEDGLPVYIPFFASTQLTDNQRYLFCVSTTDPAVFMGYSTSLSYEQNYWNVNYPTSDQITSILNVDGQWYPLGFGTEDITAMAVKLSAFGSGIGEHGSINLTPYPNPTPRYVKIPLRGLQGTAMMTITNINGQQVAEKTVKVGADNILTYDLNGLSGGTYMFHMQFTNGKHSNFRVVVSH